MNAAIEKVATGVIWAAAHRIVTVFGVLALTPVLIWFGSEFITMRDTTKLLAAQVVTTIERMQERDTTLARLIEKIEAKIERVDDKIGSIERRAR